MCQWVTLQKLVEMLKTLKFMCEKIQQSLKQLKLIQLCSQNPIQSLLQLSSFILFFKAQTDFLFSDACFAKPSFFWSLHQPINAKIHAKELASFCWVLKVHWGDTNSWFMILCYINKHSWTAIMKTTSGHAAQTTISSKLVGTVMLCTTGTILVS